MTLVYDLRTRQVLFHVPDDAQSLEIRVIPIAGASGMNREEPRKFSPTWKRYYSRHREKNLARQKHSRATHRDWVRTYNRQYEQFMTMRRSASRGAAGIDREVALCST